MVSNSKSKAARVAQVSCGCGQIGLDLHVAHKSSTKQKSFICHCRDCMKFVDTLWGSVRDTSPDTFTNVVDFATQSVHYVEYDDSHIHVVKGSKHIAFHKIFDESPILRMYSKCCRTPLGYHRNDSTFLYCPLIQPKSKMHDDEIFFVPPPQYGMHRACAPHGVDEHPPTLPMFAGSNPRHNKVKLMDRFRRKSTQPNAQAIQVPHEDDVRVGLSVLKIRRFTVVLETQQQEYKMKRRL